MLKQNCIKEQENTIDIKLDDEFQNIEDVITKIFEIIDEYDRLVIIAQNKLEKI